LLQLNLAQLGSPDGRLVVYFRAARGDLNGFTACPIPLP
jgi:hypothetical protein